MSRRSCVWTVAAFLVASAATGQSQQQTVQTVMSPLPCSVFTNESRFFDADHASIFDPEAARNLISETLMKTAPHGAALVPNLDKDYFIIHVLRWQDETAAGGKTQQKLGVQNWYVYHDGKGTQEDFPTSRRIYGAKRIWLVFVHIHDKSNGSSYEARYEVQITSKTPANQANLFALANLSYATRVGAAAAGCTDAQVKPDNWGSGEILSEYVPSDVSVTPKMVTKDSPTATGLGDPVVFDNEGRYWWDVSVGVPIRRVSELSFDNVSNTVTAKSVNKQNIYGLFNIYIPPVDIKGTNYSWVPHFVGGISIAKQPLHSVLLAAGFGPHVANFYIGGLRVVSSAPSTLQPGATATSAQFNADLRKKVSWQIAFGINLTVRGATKALGKPAK